MKGYTVFNVEQIEGLPEIYYANAVPTLDSIARVEHAEKFFASVGATIRHGGNRAHYAQELDYVQMPPFESFRDAESYYSTLAHELTSNKGDVFSLTHSAFINDSVISFISECFCKELSWRIV